MLCFGSHDVLLCTEVLLIDVLLIDVLLIDVLSIGVLLIDVLLDVFGCFCLYLMYFSICINCC